MDPHGEGTPEIKQVEDVLGILGDSGNTANHSSKPRRHPAPLGDYSSAVDGLHTWAATPLFLAENFGLGATK